MQAQKSFDNFYKVDPISKSESESEEEDENSEDDDGD